MKHITAFIKPNMLEDVVVALHKIENLNEAFSSEVSGIGCSAECAKTNHGSSVLFSKPQKIRIDLVCDDKDLEPVITAIQTHAHTGMADDGNILISELTALVDIKSGNREK